MLAVTVDEYVVSLVGGELDTLVRLAVDEVLVYGHALAVTLLEAVHDGAHVARLGISQDAMLGFVPRILQLFSPADTPQQIEIEIEDSRTEPHIASLRKIEWLTLAAADKAREQ